LNPLISALCLSLALLALPARAASHIVDIAWGTDGRFGHSGSVMPGKFLEVCGKFAVGDGVRWGFTASAPLDFNVHYHVGKATEYPVKRNQITSAQDSLRVSALEVHCWMWTNKSGQAVTFQVQLQRKS